MRKKRSLLEKEKDRLIIPIKPSVEINTSHQIETLFHTNWLLMASLQLSKQFKSTTLACPRREKVKMNSLKSLVATSPQHTQSNVIPRSKHLNSKTHYHAVDLVDGCRSGALSSDKFSLMNKQDQIRRNASFKKLNAEKAFRCTPWRDRG
jgi:hypothetical protein